MTVFDINKDYVKNQHQVKKIKIVVVVNVIQTNKKKQNLNLIGNRKNYQLSVLAAEANTGKVGYVSEDFASLKFNLAEILADESALKI